MNAVKCSPRTLARVDGRLAWCSVPAPASFDLPALLFASVLALAGCVTTPVTPARAPHAPPPVQLSEELLWQVDSDIGAASLAAAAPAKDYARGGVDNWRTRVAQRTETDFIPWFSGYWTQQWLSIKLAWYQLNAEEGTDAAVVRLAGDLEEQYRDRVLLPVAGDIDPDAVRTEATRLYVRSLAENLEAIRSRHGVPQEQFDRRLGEIPAIALAPHEASLYEVVHADPLDKLPAYSALLARLRKDAGAAGNGLLNAGISPMARRTSEKLANKVAGSGSAGVAAAVFRGVASIMISAGSAAFGAITHEQERTELEAQLRENLGAALDEMSLALLEDRATGVMAGAHYLSGQVEAGIPKAVAHPIKLD